MYIKFNLHIYTYLLNHSLFQPATLYLQVGQQPDRTMKAVHVKKDISKSIRNIVLNA